MKQSQLSGVNQKKISPKPNKSKEETKDVGKKNTADKSIYKKTTLKNGIRVITEHFSYTDAICAGIWICSGSRDEHVNQKGMAHLLEHLVFKGTKKRTAFQLAKVMESRGGDLNAFTTKENVCFHATSLAKDLKLNLDVLVDLTTRATFPKKDFENEKSVILQEIAMYADNFEEYIFDAFSEDFYKNHSMGWPILGTEGSVRAITRKHVIDYYKSTFSSDRIVVCVVGKVDHDKVVELVQKSLGHLKRSKKKFIQTKPRVSKFRKHIERDTEQSHVLIGFDAPSLKNPLRYAAYIVNTALGGGMTSILYQEVREKKGLAYTVYSAISNFEDSGMSLVYAGTDPQNQREVIDVILKNIKKIKREGFDKNMLARYKTQIKGFLTLNDDDLESRMSAVCLNEQLFGKYRALEDILKAIDEVQVSDIKKYLDKFVDINKISILTLGPKEKKNG